MIDRKAPLTAQEIEVLSRMRIPLYFNSNGETYVTGEFWAKGKPLWRQVVVAVLSELRSRQSHAAREAAALASRLEGTNE
jgi:hypothetical protein